MSTIQLDLFAPPAPEPAPHPGHFVAGGLRITRGAPSQAPGVGWRAERIGAPVGWETVAAYSPAALRRMWEMQARGARLPLDLYVRGWRRDARPGHAHWLDWPENGAICCLDTLDLNIAAARVMRPMSELRAWAAWRAQQPAKPTRARRAA
jgi:hypothetical protein